MHPWTLAYHDTPCFILFFVCVHATHCCTIFDPMQFGRTHAGVAHNPFNNCRLVHCRASRYWRPNKVQFHTPPSPYISQSRVACGLRATVEDGVPEARRVRVVPTKSVCMLCGDSCSEQQYRTVGRVPYSIQVKIDLHTLNTHVKFK